MSTAGTPADGADLSSAVRALALAARSLERAAGDLTLAHVAGLPELFAVQIGGKPFPIIWSIIGSALFVAIISLIARRRVY